MGFGSEVHYNTEHIAYYTELNLQNCNYAQKRRICRANSKYVPDFAFTERLPTSATLPPGFVDNADKKPSPKKSNDAVVEVVTDRTGEVVVGVVVVAVRL